jgi:transcriptional regulator with XRE-family HTH domain
MSTEPSVSAIADRLRTVRTLRRMSQGQLSAAVKGLGGSMCPTMVSHVEGQRKLPSLQTLVVICKVLNCSADYLLGATPPITVPGIEPAKGGA